MISFLGSPDHMLQTIFHEMAQFGLPTDLPCDHICYRVETLERYEELKKQLEGIGTKISEVPIAGRPISIFKLSTPYIYGDRQIPCIELPAPKEGSPYPEGWKHAEFVIRLSIPTDTIASLNDFMARYPHIQFKQPKVQRAVNPEATVKLSDRYNAKFHPQDIEAVIELEHQELGL